MIQIVCRQPGFGVRRRPGHAPPLAVAVRRGSVHDASWPGETYPADPSASVSEGVHRGGSRWTRNRRTISELAASRRSQRWCPTIPTWCWACRRARRRPRSLTRTAIGCAPIHPDTRHTTSWHEGDEHLRQVLDAYALLRDPARRADYDRATVLAATPPADSSRWQAQADRPRTGPVQIPITYADIKASANRVWAPPLRAGPVRRHR